MKSKEIPEPTNQQVDTPGPVKEAKEVPMSTELSKVIPPKYKPENCIKMSGEPMEIKPTKLKYFRNKSASIYSVLKVVPLNEFLAYEKGVFDKERSSDQILFDFLVAVFDNEEIVRANYDDLTAEDIEKILEIFGRINHINEKEEAARKNREAQVKP